MFCLFIYFYRNRELFLTQYYKYFLATCASFHSDTNISILHWTASSAKVHNAFVDQYLNDNLGIQIKFKFSIFLSLINVAHYYVTLHYSIISNIGLEEQVE